MEGRCAVHADAESVGTCPRCGSYACEGCWNASLALCRACVDAGHAHTRVVFEERLTGFPATLLEVWRSPRRFFSRLPDAGRGRAFVFALTCHALLYLGLFSTAVAAQLVTTGTLETAERAAPSPATVVLTVIFAAVFGAAIHVALWTTFVAVLTHAVARLAGGRTEYASTYRAVGYAHAYVLAYLPLVVVFAFPSVAVVAPLLVVGAVSAYAFALYSYFRSRALGAAGAALAVGAPLTLVIGVPLAAFVVALWRVLEAEG